MRRRTARARLAALDAGGQPAVEPHLLAMEGRHRDVVADDVVALPRMVDDARLGRAPVMDEDERLGLLDRRAHEAVALVLRHHHDVVLATLAPKVRPGALDVLDGVAEWLGGGRGKVLKVVAVGVEAEGEVQRDEKVVGLLWVERAVL